MQPSSQEIAHTRLARVQQLGELGLLEPSCRRDLLDLNEQIRPDHKVLSLLRREAEIPEDVAGGRREVLTARQLHNGRTHVLLRRGSIWIRRTVCGGTDQHDTVSV